MADATWLGALAEAGIIASLVHRRREVFCPVTGKAPRDLVGVGGLQLGKVEAEGGGTRPHAPCSRTMRCSTTERWPSGRRQRP